MYVLVHVVLLLGELLFALKRRGKNVVNFLLFSQVAFLNIVQLRVMPITTVLCIILKKLNIQPGKIWVDKSISDGNQKGDVVAGLVDETEGDRIGFVIARHANYGAASDNDILGNVESGVENSDTCIGGKSQYLMFHC